MCLCVGCAPATEGVEDAGDAGVADTSGEDAAALCRSLSDDAVDAYAELDRSCAQDSDCEYRNIGGCGCPVPVNKDADDTEFRVANSAAESTCNEEFNDDYYVGPGAQGCLNNVVCDFAGNGFDVMVVCNPSGVCDDPEF
jgi:hypothetical protein